MQALIAYVNVFHFMAPVGKDLSWNWKLRNHYHVIMKLHYFLRFPSFSNLILPLC